MNQRFKNILTLTASAFLLLSVSLFLCMGFLLRPLHLQMKAGREFMDSLTPNDLQYWMTRADEFLKQHDPNTGVIQNPSVPEDLKKAKVMGIHVSPPNGVTFNWVGGLDHTELVFTKHSDGNFTVTAVYNDYETKKLWPPEVTIK